MPKFLSQLNYEEAKINSELQIRRQKKKSSRRVKEELGNFARAVKFRNPVKFCRVSKFRNPAKLSSAFLTRLTFL